MEVGNIKRGSYCLYRVRIDTGNPLTLVITFPFRDLIHTNMPVVIRRRRKGLNQPGEEHAAKASNLHHHASRSASKNRKEGKT